MTPTRRRRRRWRERRRPCENMCGMKKPYNKISGIKRHGTNRHSEGITEYTIKRNVRSYKAL